MMINQYRNDECWSMMKYEWMNMGKFDHDLTVRPNPGIMVYFREMIPIHGRKIQVSEVL